MINLSQLMASSEVIGPGGLFDFDGTLPLVALQFLVLTFVLNLLLYTPLLTAMEERQTYIFTNLSQASELLQEAESFITKYDQELASLRKEAQSELTESQKIHQEILDVELNISQKYIDNLLESVEKDLLSKKELTLTSLDSIVQSLSLTMESKVFL